MKCTYPVWIYFVTRHNHLGQGFCIFSVRRIKLNCLTLGNEVHFIANLKHVQCFDTEKYHCMSKGLSKKESGRERERAVRIVIQRKSRLNSGNSLLTLYSFFKVLYESSCRLTSSALNDRNTRGKRKSKPFATYAYGTRKNLPRKSSASLLWRKYPTLFSCTFSHPTLNVAIFFLYITFDCVVKILKDAPWVCDFTPTAVDRFSFRRFQNKSKI